MLDYGTLPPEVSSARIYSGPGAGPLMGAAAAWDALANGLESLSRGYSSVVSRLEGESWSGRASHEMVAAVAPYIAWVATAGAQAEQAASQARAAAAAYERAFAATVPPAMVTANRMQLASLVATNVLGQNSALIADTEVAYHDMWAQDAAAMYNYAASSSAATVLSQFDAPPQTTSAAGQSAQAEAVAQAVGASTAGNSQATLSRLISAVPQQLQALATTGTSSAAGPSASTGLVPSSLLSVFSDFNTLTAPINLGDGISRTYTSAGSFGTGLFRSNLQSAADAAKAANGAAKAGAGLESAVARGPVLASGGNATTVGKLSVPQSWAVTNPTVTSIDESHWLSDADLDGGPSWHEVPATNMWNGVPPAGGGTRSGLLSAPSVNNVLRVQPRKFSMPRPSVGG